MTKFGFSVFGLSVLLWACTPTSDNFDSLANKGVLALSATNPYLGSNLFLAQEAEKSAVFFNFLKSRGGPSAMELVSRNFSPLQLHLYYPSEREYYTAEPEEHSDHVEWIVRGPFGIERKDFRDISRLGLSKTDEAAFVIDGRPYRFRQHRQESKVIALTPTLPPTVIPSPKPTPKPKKTIYRVIKKDESSIKTTSTPHHFVPLNSDQQAIQISKGFAERAANGDIVHTVKSDAETLTTISKWYAGSAGAAEQIARENGFADGESIAVGKKIRIPLNMIKEFKAMPAESK